MKGTVPPDNRLGENSEGGRYFSGEAITGPGKSYSRKQKDIFWEGGVGGAALSFARSGGGKELGEKRGERAEGAKFFFRESRGNTMPL